MDQAYRLTFEEEKGHLTLKSVRKLAMRAPAGHPHEEIAEQAAGRSVVLRDKNGRTLYRRTINGLLSPTIEYPTGDPAQPFGRVKAHRPRIVSIVVPELPGGHSVALVETPGRASRGKKGASGPVELITVRLKDHDKGLPGKEGRS